jgi:hypothetical protein
MAHRDPSSPTPLPTILRYGIAVLSVAIGNGLGFFLLQHFDAKLTPFLFAVAARRVRYWHKADIRLCTANVRYWG